MAWRCKECGGEIVAELELLKSNNFITKDKKVFLKDANINIIDFYCKECGNWTTEEELEDMAYWEED